MKREKRTVRRVKNDAEMMIDPDTYTGVPQPPKPGKFGFPVQQGVIKPGIYMQPNGTPVMIMPLLAGAQRPEFMNVPAAPVVEAPVETGKKKKNRK